MAARPVPVRGLDVHGTCTKIRLVKTIPRIISGWRGNGHSDER